MEIKGKVHCFFEQSGTFKNEFIKLGIPAEDYDIQNNFGETDHIVDLFDHIEREYDKTRQDKTRQDKTRQYSTILDQTTSSSHFFRALSFAISRSTTNGVRKKNGEEMECLLSVFMSC